MTMTLLLGMTLIVMRHSFSAVVPVTGNPFGTLLLVCRKYHVTWGFNDVVRSVLAMVDRPALQRVLVQVIRVTILGNSPCLSYPQTHPRGIPFVLIIGGLRLVEESSVRLDHRSRSP